MTDKLDYYEVKAILNDICGCNGIGFDIHYRETRSLSDGSINKYHEICFFDWRHGRLSRLRYNVDECDYTLYRLLESVKFHFDLHNYTKHHFDWSYYMKKAFTKADLKNGDVVKRRNGDVEIICVDTDTCIVNGRSYNNLSDIKNDLTYGLGYSECDIVAVRRPKNPSDCCFNAFDDGYGELVYERSEPVEMTLEEVCEALGKDIKIVKR